jgi:hypothetical protein
MERLGFVNNQTAALAASGGEHLPPTAKPVRSINVMARDNLPVLIGVSPLRCN